MQQIESLALFPLSNVVLLPEVSVPLYVFEPRYRQLTREALEDGQRIGMATVRPEAVDAMAGDPPLFEVGCMGRIEHSQERPDGTFQILLAGEQRFRLLEEHPRSGDRLYRSARVELLDDRPAAGETETRRLESTRAEVLVLLSKLIERAGQGESGTSQLEGFHSLEPARLVNVLTQAISFEPLERQQLLEADSILGRFEMMEDLLRFRLAEIGSVRSTSSALPN